ncbi:glycosyl transferase [Pseudomonas sp. 32.2.56]|jgi:predicted LPLAT superfamily acyltransferase|uniref:LpxL/LpxP family acyltransferase n=1 Tax=Pseudomonas sp. 32.2.56 TaxID=2969303 RepID=UPI0021500105|nr:glycosyl transferase [Pseudomonas sp. 32.2.56]MCR4508352.1 glycosyl transferase [Pseudomonas sp. 32.2.56]
MSDQRHWASQRERGSFILMKFTAWLARVLGRRLISPLLYLIVLYFYLFGAKARRSIHHYQSNLATWSGRAELKPTRLSVFRQFMNFADTLLDKLDVWSGRLGLEQVDLIDPDDLCGQLQRQNRGQILVAAHLGNLEVCRALAEVGAQVQMNVLLHTKHAEQFNRLLADAGASHMRLIQVSELDAAIMLQLSERLERGEWLAIAGDRVPLKGSRKVSVDFLGQPADFPQGPWLLAGLLQCPVNLMSCLKIDGRYQVILEPFIERLPWKRSERDETIRQCTQRYADRLAQRCLSAPLQWFNFYPFWNEDDDTSA